MENLNIKEEPSVEFVLILTNPDKSFESSKIKLEIENHRCEICFKVFANKYYLKDHMRTHQPKVQCKICNKSLTVQSMKDHMRNHELKKHAKKFNCDKCGKDFFLKRLLAFHLSTHLKFKNFKCEVCFLSLASKLNLRNHLRITHGIENQEFKCRKCSFTSTNHKEALLHRSKEHNGNLCKICDKTFWRKKIFENHMQIHENIDTKRQSCKVCGMKFDSLRGFEIHFDRSHRNKTKTNECDLCDKKFNMKLHLEIHKKTVHQTNRSYRCDLCAKTFKVKSSIQRHLIQEHAKYAEIFKCETCSYETKSKIYFNNHKQTHNKALACSKCDKKFATRTKLDQHFETHNDAKDYKCDQCSYAGKTSRNLHRHSKKHQK
jgi:KRAB domain-containing zinc finger protein